jgi:hypothetical protein
MQQIGVDKLNSPWQSWSANNTDPLLPLMDKYSHFTIQSGLTKKHYEEHLKEVQAELDRIFIDIREHGHTSPTGLFLEMRQEKYIETKKKLKSLTKKMKKGDDVDLQKAKAYPIEHILEIERGDFAICPFHNEKTASAKYYREDNRLHCFGCNRGADAIDIYMEINNVDFLTALKALS